MPLQTHITFLPALKHRCLEECSHCSFPPNESALEMNQASTISTPQSVQLAHCSEVVWDRWSNVKAFRPPLSTFIHGESRWCNTTYYGLPCITFEYAEAQMSYGMTSDDLEYGAKVIWTAFTVLFVSFGPQQQQSPFTEIEAWMIWENSFVFCSISFAHIKPYRLKITWANLTGFSFLGELILEYMLLISCSSRYPVACSLFFFSLHKWCKKTKLAKVLLAWQFETACWYSKSHISQSNACK